MTTLDKVALAAAGMGMAAAGAATGVALERWYIGRAFRSDDDSDQPIGDLRGDPVTVVADDGTRLYAEIDEPEDPGDAGLTVVFSHGYALNMDSWHFERRDLRGQARLVFWDQRSHGRSERGPVTGHTIDQLGRDLGRVIDECVPDGPVVLVGHSMGGMTIMALADERPGLFGDKVVGAALIATSSGGMSEVTFGLPRRAAALLHTRSERFAEVLVTRQRVIERRRSKSTDLTYLLTKRVSFGGPISPHQTGFVADMLAATPIDVLAEFLPQFDLHDKVAALRALQQVETLVIVGDSDVLTPQRHSREIARHLPGAELVVLPATGHMIINERYPEVNTSLMDLLARVRAARGTA